MASREVTTSVTIATDDVGFIIEANNTSTDTLFIYVPDNATVPISDRDEIKILRSGTGPVVVIATGTGVFLNGTEVGSATLIKQYGLASLIKVDTNSWAVAGDIVAETDTDFELITPNIPSLTQPANIQEAFLQYHYGTTTTVNNINEAGEGSIAKYIYLLDQKVQAAVQGTIAVDELTADVNLNTKTQTGYFYSPETPGADLNYPEIKSGILSVFKNPAVANGGVTQLYQTFTTTSTPSNDRIWIRSQIYSSTSWGAWTRIANKTDTDAIDNKISTIVLNSLSNVNIADLSNNQVLTYNSTQGKWINQTPTGVNGASLYRRYVYATIGTTSTTLVTLASTNTVKALRLVAVGGGGGGGSVSGAGGGAGYSESGGGSGGQYAETLVTSSAEITALANLVVFVGAGGGSAADGNRSFVSTSTGIKYVEAGGGKAGATDNDGTNGTSTEFGGSGSTLTGTGNIIINGSDGGKGTVRSGVGNSTNYGGSSVLGGSVQSSQLNGAGNNGLRYGGGGSGASSGSENVTRSGGTGGAGVVIIEVYV